MKDELHDETCQLLKKLVDDFWKEDTGIRESQIRKYKHLKLLWDGFSRVYWDETAHDWRVYDLENMSEDGNQDYYDKPINIFRAYLETVIAALSVVVPPVKCYPDDADNPLDLLTAKAADKIAQLIYRHNNAQLLWLQALFIFVTEGAVMCYTYPKEDKSYGTYEEKEYEEVQETHEITACSLCQVQMADKIVNAQAREEFQPDEESAGLHAAQDEGMEYCPQCMQMMAPDVRQENLTITRLVGVVNAPKARVCQEMYGGLYVKLPNYAKRQADCPYLIQSYDTHFALARDRFPEIRDKIQAQYGASQEPYEQWARQNPFYQGSAPENNVTIRNCWLRPASFEALDKDEAKSLKKKFPDGVRVTFVNDCVAEYENESLDDCWTILNNPLSDFVTFDPLGTLLVSVQELTNDNVSLIQQTIEHGIPQTFADEAVLDFAAYQKLEATPGAIFPAKARAGKSIGDGFYEVKTATLSPEIMPFMDRLQSYGQLTVGAQPSLFGGDIQGSKTASQYSMSRAQALQRLQNTWKMFTSWWKEIMGKSIPLYMKEMREDEKYVELDNANNFLNVVIRKSELEGKIGSVELEANENLPITWSQQKDLVLQMMEANNPQIWQMLATPDNLPLIYEALGIPDLTIPGMDSRTKQYDEIKILTQTQPIQQPPDPQMMEMAAMQNMPPPPPVEEPSVPIEELDLHQVELEICLKWINSPAGQLCKQENPPGYMNVVLHAKQHKEFMMMEMMQQAQMGVDPNAPKGEAPLPNTQEDLEAPIQGEGDVSVN